MNELWTNMVTVAPRIIVMFAVGSALMGLAWWATLTEEKHHDN